MTARHLLPTHRLFPVARTQMPPAFPFNPRGEYLGQMQIAFCRRCGKANGISMDEPGFEASTAAFIKRHIDRGERIEMRAVHENDDTPAVCSCSGVQ